MPLSKTIFEEDEQESLSLPFSTQKQESILGHLLWNKHEEELKDVKEGRVAEEKVQIARTLRHERAQAFFLQCKDRITPEWFALPFCQIIWKTAKLYSERNEGRRPSPSEIMADEEVQQEVQERRNRIQTQLNCCLENTNLFSIADLTVELSGWLKSQLFRGGFHKARDLYNRKQPTQAYAEIKHTVGELDSASFHDEKIWGFEDPGAILQKRKENVAGALTWGLKMFNELLLPEGNGVGCLLPGTTTTLVGPINAGKTTVMMTVICANIAAGKKVLYIPHEGNPNELQAKFLCCMLDRNLDWLNEHVPLLHVDSGLTDEQVRAVRHIRGGQARLRNLTFMPMIRQGLCVEEVCGSIRRKNDELAHAAGVGYHMVVSDYPAKLDTEKAKMGKLEHRHKLEEIYMSLNRLAEEIGFHHLNGAQVNREANKINKGMKGYEKRLLEMEDFAEAFGPMADTATVITINRDATAEAQERVSLHCAKSRTSAKGWTVVCRSRYKNSISHTDMMGPEGKLISDSIWYNGSMVGTELMNQVLDKFRGQRIPKDETI